MIREPADKAIPIHVQAIVAFGLAFMTMAVWLELISRGLLSWPQ